MARRKMKKQQKIRIIPAIIGVGVVSIVFCIAGLLFWRQYNQQRIAHAQSTYPVEDEKTEMKVIPPDVKKTLPSPGATATFRVPILMYHYIEYVQNKKDTIRQLLDITPDIFTQQIVTLKNAGYTFMTAKELGEVIDGKMQLPAKPVLLTFDDGHRDFYTDAFPILQKYYVKATSYVISGFLGGPDFMTKQQVETIAKSNLIDVGAHTVHHMALGGKLADEVRYELTKSKSDIEKLTHKPVVSFAYPYGSFDAQAIQLVKKAGYTTAVSTVPGIAVSNQNRYFLYRIRPGNRVGADLLQWLNQTTFSAY